MNSETATTGAGYRLPETFERFVSDLRASARNAGKPIINPRLFCSALSMDVQTLAASAHVHRVTITRAQGGEKLQGYLRDAMRVIGAATDINGNFQDAIFWFRNEPISAFDYQTAQQIVGDGRADDLLRYVQALDAGVSG